MHWSVSVPEIVSVCVCPIRFQIIFRWPGDRFSLEMHQFGFCIPREESWLWMENGGDIYFNCVCVCVFQRKVCACLWVLVGAQHLVAITFLPGEEYFSQNRKCCHHLLKCHSIPIWLTWSTKLNFVVHPSCSFPCNESKWVWLSLLSFKILPESTINIFVFRKHDEDMKYRSSLTVFHKSDKQVWNDTRVRK